jgi:hypothetical protein
MSQENKMSLGKLISQQEELLEQLKQQTQQIEQLKASLDQAGQLISLKFKEKNVNIINLDKVVREIKKRNNSNVQLHDLGTTKPEDIFISYEENGFLHIWSYGLK